MRGNPALVDYLEGLIQELGRLRFDVYMSEVLYHPEHGYYSTDADRIGARGDFYTAAYLDPAMGQLLAGLFDHMAAEVDRFTLVEIGAGQGLLARHILEHRHFPYVIVERSTAMKARQQEALKGYGVEWRDRLPDGVHGCIFSNEFFDALPVRRFVRRGGKLREVFVGEGFSEIEGDPEVPLDLPLSEEGQAGEVSLEAREWIRRIAGALDRGYHLVVDYGDLRRELFARQKGTLMCYRAHQTNEDPYSWIGEQDITAHVNFSDLIDEGAAHGLQLSGYSTQREFLVDLGLLELMEPLAMRQDASSIRRLQALKNLLLPPMMGERFKVLLQRKGIGAGSVPGFRKEASGA